MILEYIKWRGDIEFKNDRFNKIDALIFSRISYIYFDGIIKKDESILLKDAMKQFLDSKDREERTIWEDDVNLAKLLIKSDRYANLLLSDYVNKLDNEEEKQFSALLITMPNLEKVVSFRGTDNTVVGWKEDFNMSFDKSVPAQKESVKYLNKILEKYKEKITLVGHSKGGNLAIYSAIFINDKYNSRIKNIYNFDGPGFNKVILEDEKYNKILSKIKTYIPRSSIVGLILDRKEKVKIVKSSEKSIMQHDVYSWHIMGKNFVYEKNISKDSLIISKSITSWLDEIDEDKRREFIDILFDAISSINFDVKEIVTNWKQVSQVLIKTITEPVLRDMLFKSIKIFYAEIKKELIDSDE